MSSLVFLIVLALVFGGFGGMGPYGWSPAGILVIVLVILLLTGRL
jgi:heme exporter protein D